MRKEKTSDRKFNDFNRQIEHNNNNNDNNEEEEQPQQELPNTIDTNLMEQKFEEELSSLSGKRDKSSISREESLNRLISHLKAFCYSEDFFDTQEANLFRVIKQGLSSDVKEEAINSALMLSLLAISRPSWKSLQDQFYSTLTSALQAQDYDIRSTCLETLSAFCLIFDQEESHLNNFFSLLRTILKNKKERLKIDNTTEPYFETAMSMWSLLVTLFPDEKVVDEILPEYLELILQFLRQDNLNLRLAASEALSLLAESVVAKEEGVYCKDYFKRFCDIDSVIYILSTSDIHDHRKISKKDREKQRSSFKDTLTHLKTGESPSTQITVKGAVCTIESRRNIIKLDFLRNILGTGFLNHLENNPLLGDLLEADIPKQTQKILKADKKLYSVSRSKDARSRAYRRQAGRDVKFNTLTENYE